MIWVGVVHHHIGSFVSKLRFLGKFKKDESFKKLDRAKFAYREYKVLYFQDKACDIIHYDMGGGQLSLSVNFKKSNN